LKVISYKDDEGARTGILVDSKQKYHYVMLMDNPIRVRKLVKSEGRFFTDLEYKGEPYPVKRALRHFQRVIKKWHGGMKNVSKEVKAVFKLPTEES